MKQSNNKKYMMHKYWGKKPAGELRDIILKYSDESDTLLDPFAGYGGFSCEAVLLNRDVISNDLNPMSTFINERLLSDKVDFKKFNSMLDKIFIEVAPFEELWYGYDGKIITTALRTQRDEVIGIRIKNENRITEVESISTSYLSEFSVFEKNYNINDWYPTVHLFTNSRISAKPGMAVQDLFPTRALACHAKLFSIINSFEDCEEKQLLLFAFTSNLANCSRLVPPIKSRGKMSQGAWMTGFYTGETYLENNVFHYFMNRAKKVISGKKEFLEELHILKSRGNYKLLNEDAKKLSITDNSIDLVFTDFPYGDAVPYFEQSVIWNSWLGHSVDYENEIVISDSKERSKNKIKFQIDIFKSICEIHRVLKPNKYFVFTFHSLSGFEWTAISNSLVKAGLEVAECKLLIQKTLPPRQLNRKNTIKGDMLIICKKIDVNSDNFLVEEVDDEQIKDLFREVINSGSYYTNNVIVEFLKLFFQNRYIVNNDNIFNLLSTVAEFDGEGWVLL
ncbi:TPA: hypothetical protein U1236_000380 [Streptococcus suis]|nr:hypothetical protein [Streptococcus suis]